MTLADIKTIQAPSEAEAGERVNIRVSIQNLHNGPMGIMVGGALEYGMIPWPQITYPNDSATFDAWQYYYFDGYFTMPYIPPGTVKIHAYSYWYGDDGSGWNSWHYDDEMVVSITLAALPYYQLIVAILPPEGGTVNKYPVGPQYKEGTRVQLTARPKDGWKFERWSGDISGDDNPVTIEMDDNYYVYAEFVAVVVPPPPDVIELLDSEIIALTPVEPEPEPYEIELLALKVVYLSPIPAVAEIELLDSKIVSLTPLVPGMELLDSKIINLIPGEPGEPPECEIAADCPEGYECVKGKCVWKEIPEPEPPEKKFPIAGAVAIAGGVGLLVADQAKGKK